jgi:hypothetical protein
MQQVSIAVPAGMGADERRWNVLASNVQCSIVGHACAYPTHCSCYRAVCVCLIRGALCAQAGRRLWCVAFGARHLVQLSLSFSCVRARVVALQLCAGWRAGRDGSTSHSSRSVGGL